ncbi:MAG: ABC transporter ATP-binding protein [Bacillota bacterium]
MSKLQVRDLCFSFDNGPVLSGINFTAESGTLVSILGPSGCGKSTLLNILAGLLPGASGQILLDGQLLAGVSGHFAYMPQEDLLMPWRTVLDNVCLPLLLRRGEQRMDKASAREYAAGYFKQFGLQGYENKYPDQLSGGMRQRAAFLRTVLSDADVLLLDEPFGALDAITRQRLQRWLAELRRRLGRTIVLVTHDIDEAVFLSDRIYVFSQRPARIVLQVDVPTPAAERDWQWLLGTGEIKQQVHQALEE